MLKKKWFFIGILVAVLPCGFLGVSVYKTTAPLQTQENELTQDNDNFAGRDTSPTWSYDRADTDTSEEETQAQEEEVSHHTDILLVNKENPLPEDYEVAFTPLNNGGQVASVLYDDLCEMLADGENEAGCSFIIASAYRSFAKQEQLMKEEINKNVWCGMTYDEACEDALLTVAPAGYSEHETGLALDIVAVSNQMLDDTQEKTLENQWLQNNCYKYGFILRYPKGKEEITGFSYESWHFRYVGKEAAEEITRKGLALEEYIGY